MTLNELSELKDDELESFLNINGKTKEIPLFMLNDVEEEF